MSKNLSVLSNLTWKGNSPPQLHNWFLTDLVLTLLHFPCLCFLPAGGCYITEHITVLADPKQLDRLQHVITTAPRLHLLIDHQLCWIQTIKWGGSGTASTYDNPVRRCAGMSIVWQGGCFISGTSSWLICTKHPPLLFSVQSFPLCCSVCLIQHLRDEHWVSSFWVTGSQHIDATLAYTLQTQNMSIKLFRQAHAAS